MPEGFGQIIESTDDELEEFKSEVGTSIAAYIKPKPITFDVMYEQSRSRISGSEFQRGILKLEQLPQIQNLWLVSFASLQATQGAVSIENLFWLENVSQVTVGTDSRVSDGTSLRKLTYTFMMDSI